MTETARTAPRIASITTHGVNYRWTRQWQEPPPDPERLGRVVIQPDLAIKPIHAAPIDKRRLSDGAKLPSARPTPTSRRRRRAARSVLLG